MRIKKSMKGDAKSFGSLMEERQEKLYRIAFSHVKNRQDALDVVQESVYKAFISIGKLKNPEHFDTWLVRIVINNSIDLLKKSNRYSPMEYEPGSSEDISQKVDESIDLKNAMDKLEPKYKTIIVLKFFEDLTFKDIARVVEAPIGTVKTYFYRALEHLKISIEEDGSNE